MSHDTDEHFLCTDSFRKEVGTSDIPALTVKALKCASDASLDSDVRDLNALQAARVVANLVVDDGPFIPSCAADSIDRPLC